MSCMHPGLNSLFCLFVFQLLGAWWTQWFWRKKWRLCRNKFLWFRKQLEWHTMWKSKLLDLWKETGFLSKPVTLCKHTSSSEGLKSHFMYKCLKAVSQSFDCILHMWAVILHMCIWICDIDEIVLLFFKLTHTICEVQ